MRKNEGDNDDVTILLCDYLRDMCRAHNLPFMGTKEDLLLQLIPCLRALNSVDDDNNDISKWYKY